MIVVYGHNAASHSLGVALHSGSGGLCPGRNSQVGGGRGGVGHGVRGKTGKGFASGWQEMRPLPSPGKSRKIPEDFAPGGPEDPGRSREIPEDLGIFRKISGPRGPEDPGRSRNLL